MRALITHFANKANQMQQGFPGCLRARRAQINKLLWRIWASIASQFREPGDAYEGQLYIEKNAIWGCAGLVGRYPVVSAPPLYHIHFCLSIDKINKKNDHFWSFFTNYPFFCLVSTKSNLISLPFLCIITNLFSFSIVKSYFFVKNSQIS